MTHEEILALGLKLGLDPRKIIIFEPWWDNDFKARRFRLEYLSDKRKVLDWNFMIPLCVFESARIENVIKLYVHQGLAKFAEINNPCAISEIAL